MPNPLSISDSAHHQGRKLVFGGAVRLEGQLAVFKAVWPGMSAPPVIAVCSHRA